MRFVDDAEEHVTEKGVSSGARIAPTGAVLIVVRSMALAARLQIGLVRRPVAFNQDIKAVIPAEGLDARYLLYALWGMHDKLHHFVDEASHGTKRLRSDVLQAFRIPIPPLAEQLAIVGIVGSLDAKIENNQRIAMALEQIALMLFRAWFVDFANHDDLVESEIGPVPQGWEVAPVGEVLRIVGGNTPSTKEAAYWEGGTNCWATPKDLSRLESPVLLETARHITDAGVDRISSGLLPTRTVLMSSRAPVGYTAISMVPVAVNQGFIAVPPSDRLPSEYVLFWMRSNLDRIRAHAGGTTFAEISKRAFRPLPILVPPDHALNRFIAVAAPLVNCIAACMRENESLTALRDALLPSLIAGDVRVDAAVTERSGS